MKKSGWILSGMIPALLMSGCGDGDAAMSRTGGNNANSVEAVLQQQMAAETATADVPEPTVEIVADNPGEEAGSGDLYAETGEPGGDPDTSVDVDLTVMNSNMVYAEVYNMMSQPADYIDKTIKMRGIYTVFEDEESKQVYYSCIIQDATACCSQGIEFVPEDLQGFREAGYEPGDEITVEGTFEIYPDGDYLYAVLCDARLQ